MHHEFALDTVGAVWGYLYRCENISHYSLLGSWSHAGETSRHDSYFSFQSCILPRMVKLAFTRLAWPLEDCFKWISLDRRQTEVPASGSKYRKYLISPKDAAAAELVTSRPACLQAEYCYFTSVLKMPHFLTP